MIIPYLENSLQRVNGILSEIVQTKDGSDKISALMEQIELVRGFRAPYLTEVDQEIHSEEKWKHKSDEIRTNNEPFERVWAVVSEFWKLVRLYWDPGNGHRRTDQDPRHLGAFRRELRHHRKPEGVDVARNKALRGLTSNPGVKLARRIATPAGLVDGHAGA